MTKSPPDARNESAVTHPADAPAIETPRLRLRGWRESDRDAFAALNRDPDVMRDLGGPLDRAASDAKLDRYAAALARHGHGRMLVETLAGDFLGYVGIMPPRPDYPPYAEIGWRLRREAWGFGYAAEAARAALGDAFGRVGLRDVIAFTTPDNIRSQAMMGRLAMRRELSLDFMAHGDGGVTRSWLVWIAHGGN